MDQVELVPGIIFAEICDAYVIRMMLEIISQLTNTMTLKFKKKGIKIAETNAPLTVMLSIRLKANKFIKYDFNLKDITGKDVETYTCKISPKDYLGAMKVTGKKKHTTINLDIKKDGSNEGLHIARSVGKGIDYVRTSGFNEQTDGLVDFYKNAYKNKEPSTIMSVEIFSEILVGFKARKCNYIDFTKKSSGRVIISGRKDEEILSAYDCSTFTSYEYEELADKIENDDDDDHNISIAATNTVWMSKFSRLAKPVGIKIYIEIGYPLVIALPIAHQGKAVFTFSPAD